MLYDIAYIVNIQFHPHKFHYRLAPPPTPPRLNQHSPKKSFENTLLWLKWSATGFYFKIREYRVRNENCLFFCYDAGYTSRFTSLMYPNRIFSLILITYHIHCSIIRGDTLFPLFIDIPLITRLRFFWVLGGKII